MKRGWRAMLLPCAPFLFMGAMLGSFVPRSCCGSSWHSLSYSFLKVSEPNQELPQFLSVIHLDDEPIAQYDILNGKTVPLVPWMEAEEVKTPERMFRPHLEWLSNLNPQTGGLHTWQVNLGCELREDGSKRGFLHYGYNGSDFISFDKETLRWVTAQPQAEKVKEKWDDHPGWSQRKKVFLEKTCLEWLQRFLSYQMEPPKKTEPPVGKVMHKTASDNVEVLTCQAFGFYPKEIWTTWMRDGEICQYETLHRNVAPNSDGTYYVQLSIEIDPKERHRFRCHLEHEGLKEPLVLTWKEETGMLLFRLVGPVMIIILAPLILILFIICCWLIYRKKLPQAMTTCLDHFPSEKLPSFPTPSSEDEIQSQVMFPPKMIPEGCCGEKPEQREGEKRPLKASPDAYLHMVERPAVEISVWGPEERLKDAEATKPGMKGPDEPQRNKRMSTWLERKGERHSCSWRALRASQKPRMEKDCSCS